MKTMDGLTRAASGGGTGLRLFAALHVPNAQAEQLADLADALATTFEAGRPTDPATMHLTWAFLGRVAEEYVPVVARSLEAAAFEVPGPTLCTVAGCSAFGRGRVLAAEVELELLATLDAARDHFLESTKPYAPDADRRPWHPHVTILRSTRGAVLPAAMFQPAAATMPLSWVAPELRLYASLPGPAGAQHRVLHAVPFGVPVSAG